MAFTYFFRDMQTLEMIREHVLPALRTRRYIRIWDAGCAMGPEPYSLSIIFRENMGSMIFRNLRIHATDINESGSFGEVIQEGIYPEEQVKRIPQEILFRYFQEHGEKPGFFRIAEEIRKSVSYETHDLLSFEPVRRDFGLVLCKNVLLHFKEPQRIRVLRMFHQALQEGGFLVMEQTQKMPRELERLWEPLVSNAQVFRKIS